MFTSLLFLPDPCLLWFFKLWFDFEFEDYVILASRYREVFGAINNEQLFLESEWALSQ